jgi:uncharacterized protein YggT (Ycf19 family)
MSHAPYRGEWAELEPIIARVDGIDTSYLLTAVLLTDLGDILTTYIGVFMLGGHEANPVAAAVFAELGIMGLVGLKLFSYLLAGVTVAAWSRPREFGKIAALFYSVTSGIAVVNNAVVILHSL